MKSKTRQELTEEMAENIVDTTDWEVMELFFHQLNVNHFDTLSFADLIEQAKIQNIDVTGVEE